MHWPHGQQVPWTGPDSAPQPGAKVEPMAQD